MGNVHMEATQINYRGGSKKMSVEEAIKAAGTEITPEEKTWIDSIPALTTSNAGKTDQTVIAPEFDAEAGVYAVGDKVMYEGKLYRFTSAHETPGDWDSAEVSETTVDDELSSLESGLNDVNSNLVGLSNKSMLTFVGTGADGRYYNIDLSNYTLHQSLTAGVIIIEGHQTTGAKMVLGSLFGGVLDFPSDSGVTYDSTTKIITVDEGEYAWYSPYLVIPSWIFV